MLDQQTIQEIADVARDLDVEAAALAAVVHIESGSRTHVVVNGKREPLIRFEGHYFDRRLNGQHRDEARHQGLASPEPGAIRNPVSQVARWAMLCRAVAIDRRAALESTSWGVGQVMGAHWAWLGYPSVSALVAEARSGSEGQLRLMVRYIEKSGLAAALRDHDWVAFARGYNGPGFRRNGYDRKLGRAYLRYTALESPTPQALRRGSSGEAVRELQHALVTAGHAVSIDGQFGPETEAAVRAFQAMHELAPDGVAGTRTMDALKSRRSVSGIGAWVMEVIRRVVPSGRRLTASDPSE